MKMDDKYFEQKLFLFNRAMFCEYIPILMRIARDQREADVEKIKSLVIFLEGGDNYTKDQCVFNETLAVCIAALREEDR